MRHHDVVAGAPAPAAPPLGLLSPLATADDSGLRSRPRPPPSPPLAHPHEPAGASLPLFHSGGGGNGMASIAQPPTEAALRRHNARHQHDEVAQAAASAAAVVLARLQAHQGDDASTHDDARDDEWDDIAIRADSYR